MCPGEERLTLRPANTSLWLGVRRAVAPDGTRAEKGVDGRPRPNAYGDAADARPYGDSARSDGERAGEPGAGDAGVTGLGTPLGFRFSGASGRVSGEPLDTLRANAAPTSVGRASTDGGGARTMSASARFNTNTMVTAYRSHTSAVSISSSASGGSLPSSTTISSTS